MDAAMNLKFYEAILPDSVIEVLLIAFPLAAIAGTVGFVQCKSWGRSTLAVTMLLALILNTMNGLAVMRAEAASILALGCLLFASPVVLSFFPPCSDYFESKTAEE